MKTSVLVVEDFGPFRDLICSMLKSNPDLRIDCAVGNGVQAVEKAAELQPDLVLLDIGLPGLDGIEAARQIRGLSPRSKIVFVTQEHSAEVVAEALAAGASGYVAKADAGTELLLAVNAVLRQGTFVGKRVQDVVIGLAKDGGF